MIVLCGIKYSVEEGDGSLQTMYEKLEQSNYDGSLFGRRLLELDSTWGFRPRYQHTIRSMASKLVKEGLAERTGRGIYRLTIEGEDLAKAWS
jgi:hypothetical protein